MLATSVTFPLLTAPTCMRLNGYVPPKVQGTTYKTRYDKQKSYLDGKKGYCRKSCENGHLPLCECSEKDLVFAGRRDRR